MIKIGDFGISRKLPTNPDTQPTGEIGTIRYIAPEVLRSERYNKTCDVYSYAITLWEICFRQRPYKGYNVFQVMYAVCICGLRPTPMVDHGLITHEMKSLIAR